MKLSGRSSAVFPRMNTRKREGELGCHIRIINDFVFIHH